MQDFRNLMVWQKAHKLALNRTQLLHPQPAAHFTLRDH